jgi:hypothetical protein
MVQLGHPQRIVVRFQGGDVGTTHASLEGAGSMMSQRAHFWIRMVAMTVILAAEFGPRLVNGPSGTAAHAVATAGVR